ncbi:MAG: hypothetical protein RR394_03605, partial [Oscillospiraceae bacterium]
NPSPPPLRKAFPFEKTQASGNHLKKGAAAKFAAAPLANFLPAFWRDGRFFQTLIYFLFTAIRISTFASS